MGEITTLKLGYFISIFVNKNFLKSTISSSLGTEQCVTNDRHSFPNIRLQTQFSHCTRICISFICQVETVTNRFKTLRPGQQVAPWTGSPGAQGERGPSAWVTVPGEGHGRVVGSKPDGRARASQAAPIQASPPSGACGLVQSNLTLSDFLVFGDPPVPKGNRGPFLRRVHVRGNHERQCWPQLSSAGEPGGRTWRPWGPEPTRTADWV